VCNTFTVLLNSSAYEVGFLTPTTRWTVTSAAQLLYRTKNEKGAFIVAYESPVIHVSIEPGARGDVIVVTRVGNLLEFERNGKKLDVNFADALEKSRGLELSDDASMRGLIPVVYLKQKGDSVTMLGHKL
jgi:hypothetical protein